MPLIRKNAHAIDPKTSPEGLAIASGALVFALIEALRDQGVLDNGTIRNNVIQTAMAALGPHLHSRVGADAGRLLEEMNRRFT
jgi:hypothetical protein